MIATADTEVSFWINGRSRLSSARVALPTEFTAHKLQKMTLTRRHMTRMALPVAISARRELTASAPTPRVYAPDGMVRPGFNWSALGSIALMILIVVITTACAHLR